MIDRIEFQWNKLSERDRVELMRKASGLANPTAVKSWTHAPELVREYMVKRQESIKLENVGVLLVWLDKFCRRDLIERGLPVDTCVLSDVPYTYHDIYAEICRRES